MDIITVSDINGNSHDKEVVFLLNGKEKNYVLYKDINGSDLYASYFFGDINNENIKLYNDLTEEEYAMLEKLYEGGNNND